MSRMSAHVAPRISDVDAQGWDACLPGEAECHAYYAACEAAGPVGHTMAAAIVKDGAGIAAVAPLFRMAYRLDTAMQGHLRPLGEWLRRRAGRLVTLNVLGVGSPYAERCHVGLRHDLDDTDKSEAQRHLLEVIQGHAATEGIGLVAFKDLGPEDAARWRPLLKAAGFTEVGGLPVAVLDLGGQDEQAYLRHLSRATRKDLRRKLAAAGPVTIEARTDIADIAQDIEALYESTRAASGVDYGDFEALPRGYFARVSAALGERAVFMLYRVRGELAAFNLLLIEPTRVIDKFLGMRYPLAREHNLYAVSWMENVRLCLARGAPLLQCGQTAYAAKLRFGSRLATSVIYFRHHQPLVNFMLRMVSPFLAFDRTDPDLRALRARP